MEALGLAALRSNSLLTRVALGATASAVLAALVAVAVTSSFAIFLVRRIDDRRVMNAALVLAVELGKAPEGTRAILDAVADEDREMAHTGIAFAVFDAGGKLLAGDPTLPSIESSSCEIFGALHACGTPAARGLWIVAATTRNRIASLLALSSAVAVVLAGVGAWLASRPFATLLIGPLSDLRIGVDSIGSAVSHITELGPPTGIVEVDALRETIRALLMRMADSVRHAERFAADAAHEFRTPLTTIRGELELLLEEASLTPPATANLARAKQKVLDLETLVERLLILALPDQSQWSATELVSLQDLTEDSIAQLPEPEQKRVTLGSPRGDVVVCGDAALLGTLISNALANSLKFGSLVRVAVFETNGEVVLQVDDDGVGVSADQRTRVFEPFIRAPVAIEQHIPGHGLGLALIAHVARRHGGSARFLDGPPGAHLEVRLPRSVHVRERTGRAAPAVVAR